MRIAPETITTHEYPALNPAVRPYFNLEPGYYYRQEHPDVNELSNLPFVPSSRIEQGGYLEDARPIRQQFPVERIVSTSRPMENWAAKGEQKINQQGVILSTNAQVVEFLNRGNYKNQEPPIRIVPFTDDRGEIWGMVQDGNHRVMSAKLAGERAVTADVYDVNPAHMNHYKGDIIGEMSTRRPLYNPATVPDALQDLRPGADMRDAVASSKADDAWARFFSPVN